LAGVVSPAEVPRLLHVLAFAEKHHGEIEKQIGPHYYLAMLGITPQWQGRGWGDALLKPMLDHCDEEGATAYLESSTRRSVRLYARNGFETIAVGRYRGATEPLTFMYRRPR
jgi:GNAT superfamily N-acetyltransferase